MSTFTRKEIKELFKGADITLPADILTSLCEMHTESQEDAVARSVEALNDELGNLQEKLKVAEPNASELAKVQKEFDDYKTSVATKKNKSKLDTAKTDELKKAGFAESIIDLLINDKAFSAVSVGDDGKVVGVEDAVKAIAASRADLITKVQGEGGHQAKTPPPPPPAGELNLAEMSAAEYSEYWKKRRK